MGNAGLVETSFFGPQSNWFQVKSYDEKVTKLNKLKTDNRIHLVTDSHIFDNDNRAQVTEALLKLDGFELKEFLKWAMNDFLKKLL